MEKQLKNETPGGLPHTRESLKRSLRACGLSAGDLVMAHASMRAVGPILGGPDELIAAILETIHPNGAIMMYVGSETPFDDVGRKTPEGRPRLGDQEPFVLEHCPAFDPAQARAVRDHGILAEIFRTYNGTICSHHVGWRMAAHGDRAAWLVADHPMNYGADAGSPMDKLVRAGGKLLLLGSDLDHTTLLHYAEGLTQINPKRVVNIKVPLLQGGKRTWVDVEEHDSSIGIIDWPDRYFEALMKDYIAEEKEPKTFVGNAPSYLINARDLVDYAVDHMEKTARGMTPS